MSDEYFESKIDWKSRAERAEARVRDAIRHEYEVTDAMRARIAALEGVLRRWAYKFNDMPDGWDIVDDTRAALAAGGPPAPVLIAKPEWANLGVYYVPPDGARPAPPPDVPMTGTEISIRARYEGRDPTAELEALRQRLTAAPRCTCLGRDLGCGVTHHDPDCPAHKK